MRVIAGKYRSRPLASLRGMDIRPTSDRLRETLFNVLTQGNPEALLGTVWLDLFAGTGAVGIEALSRGAKEVHFVENSPAAAEAIRKNLENLGVREGFRIVRQELPPASRPHCQTSPMPYWHIFSTKSRSNPAKIAPIFRYGACNDISVLSLVIWP